MRAGVCCCSSLQPGADAAVTRQQALRTTSQAYLSSGASVAALHAMCGTSERPMSAPASASGLQAVLGFRGQRGHRVWRRIKPALAKKGNIEEVLARTETDKAIK